VSSRKNENGGRIAARLIGTLFTTLAAIAPVARSQVTPTPQSALQTHAISLDEAVRTAEAQSEAIRIARAGVQRAEGQQYQARSLRLPQLGASASYTRTLASQFSSAGGSEPAVDTTKPAPPPAPCDQYLLDATATTAERLAGLEDANRCALGSNPFSSFGSLGFGAKNQYNAGLSFSQNLFTGGRISGQNTVLRQTQLARNVGNVSEFELLRAQVSSANQRPIVIQRQSDREVAYLRLKQLLNLPLDNPIQLTTVVDDPAATTVALNAAAALAGDTAAADRASVRQAAEAIDAQRGLLKVAKSQRFPTLALTSQYGKVAFPLTGLPGSGDFRTNWTVAVASQFPLFTGGRIKGEQMVAEANLRESQARYDQLREFAALDSRVTINNLLQARAAWQASLGTAEQATRAYAIAEVRYREGISTQLELNDARILLEQAVANRALAARDLQVASVKLALLPDLPLQTTGAAQAQAQSQASAQQQAQQSQQAAQQQAQAQQSTTGIPQQ
jgi:outer membrane protein